MLICDQSQIIKEIRRTNHKRSL